MQNVHNLKMTKSLVGSTFSCTWRSPVGYKLKTNIKIDDVKHQKFVSLISTGDLDGSVTCTLAGDSDKTTIEIDWQVDTRRKWMNTLRPILKPIFIASHHKVMDSGLHGFNKYLASKY